MNETQAPPATQKPVGGFWQSESDRTGMGPMFTSQKSEDVIEKLFNAIMPRRDPKGLRSNSTPSLQQEILSQWPTGDQNTRPSRDATLTLGSKADVKIRRKENDSQRRKREELLVWIAPALEYIERDLPTNQAITEFFETKVAGNYNFECPSNYRGQNCDPRNPVVCEETASLLLNACIHTLRHTFKDPVGALYVFDAAKRASYEFFKDACTAESYNEILEIRWHDYRDLYAVLQLATEIAINAVEPNERTEQILSRIYLEAKESSSGLSPSESLPLWTGVDQSRLSELNRFRSRFSTRWASQF